jgi:hypothetical protein
MKKAVLFCILLCGALPFTQANQRPPLYQMVLPVATDDAAVREAAFASAFEQLLIKISGNSQILVENPDLKKINAVNEVASYHYQGLEKPSAEELPFLLTVNFQEPSVLDNLKKINQVAWTDTRPTLLAWITIRDQQGLRLLGVDLDDELLQKSQDLAEQRGIPWITPLVDLSTLNQISLDDITHSNWALLEKVSAPYQHGATLLLQITQNIDGSWTTHSQLLIDEATQEWTLIGPEKAALLTRTLNTVMDAFAHHYTILLATPDNTVTLQINQVSTLEQYIKTKDLLSHLSMIPQISTSEVSPSNIRFTLKIKGDEATLQNALKGLDQLAPVDNPTTPHLLTYAWKPPAA